MSTKHKLEIRKEEKGYLVATTTTTTTKKTKAKGTQASMKW